MGTTPVPEDAPIRKGRLTLRVATEMPTRLIGGAWMVEALHDGPSDELRLTVRSLPGTEHACGTRVTLDRTGAVVAVHPVTPDA